MYWIYLIIFILAVFSPDIIHRGLFFVNKDLSTSDIRMLEELTIFFLGMLGFLIFMRKEKQLRSNIEEKSKIQKEMNAISKDLKASYSYIGETNRKLEILKNIALGFPADADIDVSNKEAIYTTIKEALKTLSKTKNFIIRIVDDKTNNSLKEIIGQPNLVFKIKNSQLQKMTGIDHSKNKEYFVFHSKQKVDKIKTYIIIKKERTIQIEDLKLIETLATQTLFLYLLTKKVKTNTKN